MVKCTFCKRDYNEQIRGTTVVDSASGKISYFCSSKCRKNSEMGRDNKKVMWVRKANKEKKEA
ncbi:MAG: 50S ribosomal protein L24e [archaeon]